MVGAFNKRKDLVGAFSRSFKFREGSLTALLFIYVWGLAGQLVTCRWITGYRDWAEVVMTLTAELGLHRVKLNILGINLMLCCIYV